MRFFRRWLRSPRACAIASVMLGIAAGAGVWLPAYHGCPGGMTASSEAHVGMPVSHAGDHGTRHSGSQSDSSSECSCIGDICGVTSCAPLPEAPVLSVVVKHVVPSAPVYAAPDRPALAHAHLLPFANGPPAAPLA